MANDNLDFQNRYVYLKCNIRKIDKINSLKEDFWCNFSVSKYWYLADINTSECKYINNSQLLNNDIINNKCSLKLSEPKTHITNLIKYTRKEIIYDIVLFNNVYYIEKTSNYFAKLKANFDYHNFPKDSQKIEIIIQSNDDNNKIKLLQSKLYHSKISALNTFQHDHEWEIEKPLSYSITTTQNYYSTRNNEYSQLTYYVYIKRKSTNYLWNIIVLNFLISLASFTSYSIDYDNSGDRLNISVMLLLTKVAFKQLQNTITPNITYFTMLDKYIVTGLFFLFLVILQNTISPFFSEQFDNYSFIGLGIFFLVYNLTFSIFWLYK